MLGTRTCGQVVVGLILAASIGCGGGNNESIGPGVKPDPGVFQGTTELGESITIEAGSIERIALTCDDEQFVEIFAPPAKVLSNGTFDVTVHDQGRHFHIVGRFDTNQQVTGTIDDDGDVCDTGFTAFRTNTRTPTPTFTITPGPGTTATPVVATATPTATAEEPTPTDTATFTPSPGPGTPTKTATPLVTSSPTRTATPVAATETPTPTVTATPAGPTCGNLVKEGDEECDSGLAMGGDGLFTCPSGTQCFCCYCRPVDSSVHGTVTSCSTAGCHAPPNGQPPKPPKAGAVETIGNVCN